MGKLLEECSVRKLLETLEQKATTAFIISEDVEFADQEDEYDRVAQQKWVSLEDVTALLIKLVQERDDNKLLVIQAVTKLRAKEEELEGDRKQLLVRRDDYQKKLDQWASKGKWNNESIALSSAISELNWMLLEGSGEPLNLALAFTDVKKKKKDSK